MKKYHFSVLIEQDEDGVYIATVPQLRGCHTQAKTVEELYSRIREAIELCLEVQLPPIIGEEVVLLRQQSRDK